MNTRVQCDALRCMSVIQEGKVQFLEDFLEAECAFLQSDGLQDLHTHSAKKIRSGYLLID
jgi:hypothetical protein